MVVALSVGVATAVIVLGSLIGILAGLVFPYWYGQALLLLGLGLVLFGVSGSPRRSL